MNEQKTIERIRCGYQPHELTKMEELKKLDKKVRRPVKVFAYIFGSLSALVFGTGMSLSTKVIFANLPSVIGILIGVGGIILCVLNYLIYKGILSHRKKKYAEQILQLCDQALNKEEVK